MFEGNISSFLGMSGNDGIGDYSTNNNNGSYSQRVNARRNHYIKTGYKSKRGIDFDPETGEILDFKPLKNIQNPYKMARNYATGLKLPEPKKVLDLFFIAAIVYGAYWLYKKFSRSPIDQAADQAEVVKAKSFVDTTVSATKVSKNTSTSLKTAGLESSDTHEILANDLHDIMDKFSVDHDKLIATIGTMSKQTFQLVNTAYGTRALNIYARSPLHVFSAATFLDSFSDQKLVGTLKYHLTLVLSDSEQHKISDWLNAIS